jgi:guanine deaminase
MDRASPKDYVEAGPDESMESTHEFLELFPRFCANTPSPLNGANGTAYNQPLVRPILTPRFALSCSPPLMAALGKLAKDQHLPIQTHISENKAEIEAVRRAFPDLPHYAGVYDHFGLLTDRTVLAHGVHLTPPEVALIAARGAGVSHCPTSNVNLNSGAARVLSLLEQGVKVGLGSDCSGGPATGVLAALRSADAMSRVLAFEGAAERGLSIPELFFLATRGGAEIAGVDAGSFEPGREFDALWVRPRSPGFWAGGDTRALFEKWLFAGDDRDIGAVWVRGRCVSGAPP